LVLDRVTSAAEHDYRLHWLLIDAPYEWDESTGRLMLRTPVGSYHMQVASSAKESACSLLRADESSPRGWRAAYYNCREPALSLELTTHASAVRFWTLFGPEPGGITASEESIELQTDEGQVAIQLNGGDEEDLPLIASVRACGAISDHLENI
jgi:hypothetical protein